MAQFKEELHYVPESVNFSIFSVAEVRRLSRVDITSPTAINELGQPVPCGLYDLRMGPYTAKQGVCATCRLNDIHCPGHMGHIELAMPLINPLFRSFTVSLLSRCCLYCSALLYPAPVLTLFSVQLELLRRGLATDALAAGDFSLAANAGTNAGKTATTTTASSRRSSVSVAEDTHIEPAPSETIAACVSRLREHLARAIDSQQQTSGEATVSEDVRNVVMQRREVVRRFLSFKPLKQCPECRRSQPSLNDFLGQIVKIVKTNAPKSDAPKEIRSYLTSVEARDILRGVWAREKTLLSEVFGVLKSACDHQHPTDCFFIEALLVTSPKTRPMSFVRGRHTEHSLTYLYSNVLTCSQLLKKLLVMRSNGQSIDDLGEDDARAVRAIRGTSIDEKVMRTWGNLQGLVDCVVDMDMNKMTARRLKVKQLRGVRQVLEKKEGIIRMNMMGKRVDFAGRTVITPDPYLSVEEMGVPEAMACRLTYPEPVNAFNVQRLQQAVLNGPNVHPGATAVEFSNGYKVLLKNNKKQLASCAASLLTSVDASSSSSDQCDVPNIVHRHLHSGDVVLLNRQPTLHRPSIMAHKVRVLPAEKTFRLHYSNCKSYNADFDGDEMNLHLPQGEEARGEALHLAYSPHHFLVPKDGSPLGGLIQDHVVAGVKLTMRGRFFERAQYMQLVASGLSMSAGRIRTLPPAIYKPRCLWSGKQVMSTLIINLTPAGCPPINLDSRANLGCRSWQRQEPRSWRAGGVIREPDMCESHVVIRDGHLVCGVLDKKQYGAVPFSLIHGFYELYGGVASSRLLSAFSRLFTDCLHVFGFTLGVKDILVSEQANAKRCYSTTQLMDIGVDATRSALEIGDEQEDGSAVDVGVIRRQLESCHLAGDRRVAKDLDRAYKQRLDAVNNDINKACLSMGLIEKFPENNLQLMVEAGAKGSKVNTMQISCLLGQIELEGKRPPRMISGKTLPSFVPYDLSPRAGGFISCRFMTGVRPQEYFFHCMAGREGLIDTAVKTSRSGYLQRCLIKHLEGLVVGYDLSVRDSDGSVIQMRYGEDGHETQKVQYLNDKQMRLFDDNRRAVVDDATLLRFKNCSAVEEVSKAKKRIKRWRRHAGSSSKTQRNSGFLEFCRHVESVGTLCEITDVCEKKRKLVKMWRELDERAQYHKLARRCPDPVSAEFRPNVHFSSVCETLEDLITSYMSRRKVERRETSAERQRLTDLLYYKCARSCVESGEAVGLVAAQSIGEPSTQMTLNTFHFAGRGDMNVTLGIPRLKEILGAAKVPKTPSMEVPFRSDVANLSNRAERLRLELTRVTLSQVLRDVTVTECLKVGSSRLLTLKLRFLPRSVYKHQFLVNPASVLQYVEKYWIRLFLVRLSKALKFKDSGSGVLDVAETASGSQQNVMDDEAGDEDAAAQDHLQEEDRPAEADANPGEYVSSDEEANGDGDATASRSRARRADQGDYESDEDEDDVCAEDNFHEELEATITAEDNDDVECMVLEVGERVDVGCVSDERAPSVSESKRRLAVLTQRTDCCSVQAYSYDEKHSRWCQLTVRAATTRQCDVRTVVREAAAVGVVRQVPHIQRAFVVESTADSGGLQLCTEGINMTYLVRHADLLDLGKLHCNDVHTMAATYGVEAAQSSIVREIGAVFGVYGIRVSARHLSLVADYMTFSGEVTGFNRSAMNAVVSPVQQMSFETTVRFLRSAVLSGQQDLLKSPSARLVFGQSFHGGTGMFSVINKLVA